MSKKYHWVAPDYPDVCHSDTSPKRRRVRYSVLWMEIAAAGGLRSGGSHIVKASVESLIKTPSLMMGWERL